ncbi:hypothetical protein V6N11_009107 [Hibiscus sabdariffa]|uniref:Uncharacterized protein n=1 Tax=Hibiscus sabdariffa TaxID=183260 RepID=A0ABR2PQG2_9ROSI
MVSKLWVIPLEKYCRSPSMVLVWIWMKGGNDLAGGRIFTTLCLVSERLSMARARVPPKYGAMDGVSISIVSLVSKVKNLESDFESVWKWTWVSEFRWFKPINVKVLLSPTFMFRVRPSCPSVWYRNVHLYSEWFVNFSTLVHLLARMRVGLMLSGRAKIFIQWDQE